MTEQAKWRKFPSPLKKLTYKEELPYALKPHNTKCTDSIINAADVHWFRESPQLEWNAFN